MRNGFFGIAFRVFLYIWFAISAYFFLFSDWLNSSTLVYLFDAGRIDAEDIVLYREGRFERLYLVPQFLYLYMAESMKGLALTVVFAFLGILTMYILKVSKLLNLMADLKGGSLRGMNIANGAFPRPPKVPKYQTLEAFEIKQLPKIVQDWIEALNPARKKLALSVLSMMKQSKTPATIHSFGHGGMSVYDHTLLVLVNTLENYEKFIEILRLQYAIKDKYFGFLGLCALCHDLGKLETYKKDGDGYIQVKADHCWQSGHILNRMDEFWAMDPSDQTNLRQVVQYVEKPWALRDDTDEIVYRVIEFLKYIDTKTARTESTVSGKVGNAATRKGQVTLDDLTDDQIVSTFVSLLKLGETVHTSNPKMNWGYKVGRLFYLKQDRFLTRLAVELGDESLAEIKDGSGTRILAARLMNKMQENGLAPEIVFSEKGKDAAVKYKGSRLWFLIRFADADGKVKAGNEWHYTTLVFADKIASLKDIEDSWVKPTIIGSHQAGSLSNVVSKSPAVTMDGQLIDLNSKAVPTNKPEQKPVAAEMTKVSNHSEAEKNQDVLENEPLGQAVVHEQTDSAEPTKPTRDAASKELNSIQASVSEHLTEIVQVNEVQQSTALVISDDFFDDDYSETPPVSQLPAAEIDPLNADPFADDPLIVQIPNEEELEQESSAGMITGTESPVVSEQKEKTEPQVVPDKRLQRLKPAQIHESALVDLSTKSRAEITEQQKKDMAIFVSEAELSTLEMSYLFESEKPYEKNGKFGMEYSLNEAKLFSFGKLKYTGLPDAAYESVNKSAVLVVPDGPRGKRTIRLIIFGRHKSPF